MIKLTLRLAQIATLALVFTNLAHGQNYYQVQATSCGSGYDIGGRVAQP